MNALLDRPVEAPEAPTLPGLSTAPPEARNGAVPACPPVTEGNPGPEIPPLLRGLPNTDDRACKSLLGAVLWQSIQDMDIHFIASNGFTNYGVLMGLELSEVFAIRRQVLSGKFKPSLYSGISWNADYDR